MINKVALVKQIGYDKATLAQSVRRAIELSDFDLSACRGTRVLLKPNMVEGHEPEQGITTHPAFVQAVGKIFKEAGAEVWVGDNPMAGLSPDAVSEATGIKAACIEAGLIPRNLEASGNVVIDGFPISRDVAEADFVVNLPKFKTHLLTMMTLAVKNLFGCMPGDKRPEYHRLNPKLRNFAETLVRIADAVQADLNIVDGIVAMEGGGPTMGTLTDLSVIIAGKDTCSVDCVCCTLLGLNPMQLETLRAAQKMGGWDGVESVQMVGDPLASLRPGEFSIPYELGRRWLPQLLKRILRDRLSPRPQIDEAACKLCGLCVKSCPAGAIEWKDETLPPVIRKRLCIKCYCCSEVCPNKAIAIDEGWILRLFK